MYKVESLKKLALLGAIEGSVKLSSSEFAKHTSTGSKTAARVLKKLEEEQLIERQLVPGGQLVRLNEKALELLKSEYADYQRIFCKDFPEIDLFGTVITGLGEGQYYIAKEGYMSQFKEKLGFTPFPGTLNVRLDELSAELRDKIDLICPFTINGFNDGERTFGGGKCYPVEIGGIKAAVIIPDRSHYPADLLEIMAPVKLREKLGLDDGDNVKIVVKDPQKCE
ncbi:winged helix-turn-helix domain-containing protein/riboflavin kinase [Methanolobus sp. ZRKC3]|uniref:winged helix-turn-helix domain-containing protein/riboflavin kinase n=1 Tax=Methanolobus sp. ZRKC3 TaxID=3125786 RepID=UPI00324D2AE6